MMSSTEDLQDRVVEWIRSRFGDRVLWNRGERAARVVEEAIELAQAEGVPPGQIAAIAFRIYGRPPGRPEQEAAGVCVTMLAYAAATATDLEDVTEAEVDRIEKVDITELRRRHQEKADAGTAIPPKWPA